jgi:RNA polymerase sigma factor (sigma-70 family)
VTDDDLDVLMQERRRLLALAYRMMGTISEAEDVVQETYLRWYRLGEAERAQIENPQAWLTRVASRVCLDALKSARARRERYVGEWLPEPIPPGLFAGTAPSGARSLVPDSPYDDPFERVTLDDAVSTALMVVLESMTPAERMAFVLHDVFAYPFPEIARIVGRTPAAVRQLATSARRRVHAERENAVAPGEHDRLVHAFVRAARSGDLEGLMAMLEPSATLRSDGGGVVSAARNPVVGADRVARFVIGSLQKRSDVVLEVVPTADGAGLSFTVDGAVLAMGNLRIGHDGVTDVWMVVNPHKLTQWETTSHS